MEQQEKELNPSLLESNEEAVTPDLPVEKSKSEQEPLLTNEEDANLDLPIEEVIAEQIEEVEDNLHVDKEICLTVEERLTAIEEELKRSNQLIESKFLYDSTKEEMITRLHKELQAYKDDLFKKILKPIIMDMIAFTDNMNGLISRYEEVPETELLPEKYQKLRNEFLKIGSHIEDVIYNYGVESFSSKQGDEFNSRTQQAKKNTITENPDEHKKIINSLSSGYTWDEQLLRREIVHVSIYEQSKENTSINQ